MSKAPEASELRSDLAAIYQQDGEHQQVIALYEQIYQQNPNSLNALNTLASYVSDYASDAALVNKIAKLAEPLSKTNDPYMLDTVAWLFYKQGDYQNAHDLLLKVLELDAGSAVSNYHLGMVYFQQGDKARAKQYLQKAVTEKEAFTGWDVAHETLALIAQ
jgi:tetratricopeptide (TPR) repeat protein